MARSDSFTGLCSKFCCQCLLTSLGKLHREDNNRPGSAVRVVPLLVIVPISRLHYDTYNSISSASSSTKRLPDVLRKLQELIWKPSNDSPGYTYYYQRRCTSVSIWSSLWHSSKTTWTTYFQSANEIPKPTDRSNFNLSKFSCNIATPNNRCLPTKRDCS